MRLAVIGSRRLYVRDLGPYLPDNVTEIVSGGAKGIDGCAGEYARRNGIPLTEFLPDYRRYGKGATCKSSITPTNCSPSGTGIPEARISSSVRQG